jgi:hypothetical protein
MNIISRAQSHFHRAGKMGEFGHDHLCKERVCFLKQIGCYFHKKGDGLGSDNRVQLDIASETQERTKS